MAKDAEKREIYFQILSELEKFNDPAYEQRLTLIQKKIWPNDRNAKQKLNHYLQRFVKLELIRKVQSQPFAIYKLNVNGATVKDNLITNENTHKTVTWGYENLLVGYEILYWGSWKFRELGHRSRIRMTNWSYQLIKTGNGLQAKVQDTGLLLISGPSKIYGPDGDELKMRAHAMVQDAARWFVDHYDMKIGEPQIKRPGEKYLPDSTVLAKILGNFNVGDYYVNASPPTGEPHLEEKDNSLALENILKTFQETPRRLEGLEQGLNNLNPVLQQLTQQLTLHLDVEAQQLVTQQAQEKTQGDISQGISELRAAVHGLRSGPGDALPTESGVRPSTGLSGIQYPEKTGLSSYFAPVSAATVQIEFIRATPKFKAPFRGAARIMGPFSAGARIYLDPPIARQIVRDGYAKEVREDKARSE